MTSSTDPFARARERDPLGHQVHTAFAAVFLFLVPLATFPKDPAFIILFGYALMRSWATWRTYLVLLRDPLLVPLLAWAAWETASLLWSPVPAVGAEELRVFRFLLMPLALWPVLDRVGWLVAAVLAGVAAQNALQLTQGLLDIPEASWSNGRLSAWQHPIHTGTICVMALCWHLVAIVRGRVRARWIGGAGVVSAAAGLVATGSRGPWLSALLVLPATLIVTALRAGVSRRVAIVTGVTIVIAAAAAWPLAGSFVGRRVEQARADVQAAWDGDLSTDIGLRVVCWRSAWGVFRETPIHGAGAGGFGRRARGLPGGEVVMDDHDAHCTYLHVLASGGVIGVVLLAATLVTIVIRAVRDRIDHLYAGGAVFALVAWLVGALFDASHLNGTMFAMLMVVAVVTAPGRPPATALAEPDTL